MDDTEIPASTPRGSLQRMLVQARKRRNPADIPGFANAFGSRDRPGVKQHEVAHLTNVSRNWYGRLETGKEENYSEDFLDAVRRVLDLNDEEWAVLYRIVRHVNPPSPKASGVEIPEAAQETITHISTWPAYINDLAWDILVHNDALVECFPALRYGANVMAWALTFPEARTQLINWEREWAMPMIAQLRLHADQWPDHKRLQEVVQTVLEDPVARRLWHSPALPSLSHPSPTTVRRLYLPRREKQVFRASFFTSGPDDITMANCRFMCMTYR